jgi:hypothetical protein
VIRRVGSSDDLPNTVINGKKIGSAADFKNGGHVISYSKEPLLLNSKNGDRVNVSGIHSKGLPAG